MKLEDLVSIDPLVDFLSGTQAVAFSVLQRQGHLLPVDTGNAGQIQLSDFTAAGQRHRHTLPIASDSLRCLVDEDQRLFPTTGHPTDWPIP